MSDFEDDTTDAANPIELHAGEGEPLAAPERPFWKRAPVVGAAIALAGLAAFAWWPRGAAPEAMLAVAPAQAAAARAVLAGAGIPSSLREGSLWVASSDARRAVDALAHERPAANAMSAALADESVFASADATRARRQAAAATTDEDAEAATCAATAAATAAAKAAE